MEVISRVFQLTTTEASSTTDNKQVQIAEKPLDQILSTTAASLSILGSLTIIITFCLWPDVRTKSRFMIVFISFGDLLVASSNIIGIFLNNDLITCEIQATVNIAAILSSFFWTVYLSLYFYLTICKKITERTEKITMWLFHVTAWGIPVVIAAVGFGVQAVGNSQDMVSSGWCWIKSESGKAWWWTVLWMSIAGKGWEILAYIAISVFCVLVKLQIKHEVGVTSLTPLHGLSSITFKYPLVSTPIKLPLIGSAQSTLSVLETGIVTKLRFYRKEGCAVGVEQYRHFFLLFRFVLFSIFIAELWICSRKPFSDSEIS